MTMIYSSRALLERVLRERVEEIPNVDLRNNTQAVGLEFTKDQRIGVTGVRYAGGEGYRNMTADLVVDATGRGARCAGWIEKRGVGRVPVRNLDARVMYSSRWYQEPDSSRRPADWWWQHMAVLPDQRRTAPDEHQYLCTIFPVEDRRWIAFMGAWGLDLPKTPGDFADRAGKVRTPLFSRALEAGTPLSEVFTTRSTANVWRRFDLLDPVDGFVALGDSVCAFNPLYGQGMSAAAVSATLLKRHLAAGNRTDLPQRFSRVYNMEQPLAAMLGSPRVLVRRAGGIVRHTLEGTVGRTGWNHRGRQHRGATAARAGDHPGDPGSAAGPRGHRARARSAHGRRVRREAPPARG